MKGAKATWSVVRNTASFLASSQRWLHFRPADLGIRRGRAVARLSGLFASGNGTIDGQGNLTVDAGKADAPGDRPTAYTIEAEVQDVSRQTVAGRTSVLLHPASFYIGISARSIFTTAGQALRLPVIAAKPDGTRLAGVSIKLTALSRAWHSVRKKGVGGVFENVTEAVDEVAGSCEAKTAAADAQASSCELMLAKPGFYTLRAEIEGRAGTARALEHRRLRALGPGFAAWRARGFPAGQGSWSPTRAQSTRSARSLRTDADQVALSRVQSR